MRKQKRNVNRNLFVCDTPFQVLAALLLIYNDGRTHERNDFIVTDHMQDAGEIAKHLRGLECVRYAYPAKVNHTGRGIIRRKTEYLLDHTCRFGRRWNYKYADCPYDTITVRNFTEIIAVSAYVWFRKLNPGLRLCIMDEGYSTYTTGFWESEQKLSVCHKLVNRLLQCGADRNIYKKIDQVRLFRPELLHVNLPFPTSRMLDKQFTLNQRQIAEINHVFCYSEPFERGKYKYVFFEQSFFADYGDTGDVRMLKEIAAVVGKENIIVKLHPRSGTDRFGPLGFSVMKQLTFPWELFAINHFGGEEITLLSHSSGSLLNYLFFSDARIHSVFLYKVYTKCLPHITGETGVWFDEFCSGYTDTIRIPDSREELKQILRAGIKNHGGAG